MQEKLFRKAEALEFPAVSRPMLDRLISSGALRVVKLTYRAVRTSESALRELVERRTERRGL